MGFATIRKYTLLYSIPTLLKCSSLDQVWKLQLCIYRQESMKATVYPFKFIVNDAKEYTGESEGVQYKPKPNYISIGECVMIFHEVSQYIILI